ncbi:MAG: acetyl-CoA acetyltransferase [Legionellales bacterium RIFCSPHIGHO2_12_FULL_37_14]|nr:MAG: acetyl-CoA acetyltransferase [Legionellales bacterium RIFCSPHIGHO2_12_FULL_37_14]
MKQRSQLYAKPVYIVDGLRTPFLKAKGVGPFSAADLATLVGAQLLKRQPFAASAIDAVVLGCVMPSADEANIARIVALRLGLGDNVPAETVMRNCASGMQSIDTAALEIAAGRNNLMLAGGVEVMSRAPLLLNLEMTNWLGKWTSAKSIGQRAQALMQLRLAYFKPIVGLLRGLTDPTIGLNMGQTAEELALRFAISREEMDEFAVASHKRAAKAYEQNLMSEVCPIIDFNGRTYTQDDGIRKDSTLEKLATLKPFFDKKFGTVTAANSSQVTDGAALLLLASEEAIKKYDLPVLGRIIDTEWAALAPVYMGLGPAYAMAPILTRQKLGLDDIDTFEINEAFAAQVIACNRALASEKFCQEELFLKNALGAIDLEKLNPNGGAIALGHPVGASGARIVLHALKTLEQNKKKRAMASICIGGGQGGAMYIEREGK